MVSPQLYQHYGTLGVRWQAHVLYDHCPQNLMKMIVQEGREALRSALSSAETRDGTVARLLKG
jgi:hypothetical protein